MTGAAPSAAPGPAAAPPRGMSLRRNFSWTLAGNLLYAACQWGMVAALARLGSPEAVGRFALGAAVATPILMFTNLQLRQAQATDARGEYAFPDYLGLRLLTSALALAAAGAWGLVAGYRGETLAVLLAFMAGKAVESICDVFYGHFQQRERMDHVARSLALRGLLALLALAATYAATGSLVAATVAMGAAWLAVLLLWDLRAARALQGGAPAPLGPRWRWPVLRRLVTLSLPLGVSMMLISLNANVPRYFVEQRLGPRALGVFAAMAYVMVAGTTVVAALGQSAAPRLARLFAAGDRRGFRRLLGRLVAVGAALGVAGVLVAALAGRPLLTLLYGAEYADPRVFLWVMVAAGLGYVGSFLGYGITATRAFRRFTLPYAAVTAVAVAASAALIGAHGLLGAAWTLCLTSLATCLAPLTILLSLRLLSDAPSTP